MGMIGIAAGLAMAAAASAASPKAGQAGADDPNREICKSRPVIGSRVKRVRECHTAAQWEEMKLQEQLGMMRRQTNGDSGCNFNEGSTATCGVANGGRDTPW